ncbi:MAG: hypothetical protein IKS08_01310 [Alphaproteobacteria bacterium]|nr:hypothetical protein [Alphaproteobacteria bacterium]
MKFMKYTSLLCLVSICALDNAFADNPPAPRPVYMTSQIQRLLNEKQEKISKLEECDGKRKGFMIAGISTIGLTAVGVGVNIAQANKSNKLSNQIADQNRELEKQQSNLANINSQISEIQSNNARRECESKAGMIFVNGQCLDKQQYEQSIAQNQNGNNNQNNNQNAQQNNTSGNIISPHDGIIGEACMDGAGVWDKYDAGEKNCLVSKNTTEIVKCGCKMKTSLNQIPVVGGANAVGGETASEKTPSNGEITGLKPIQLNSIPVPETMPTTLPQRDNSENPNRPPKVEPITLQPKGPGLLPTKPIEPNLVPLQRPATITGLCLNEEGDQAKGDGDFCWCHIDMPDYCRKDITTPIKGVCNGDTNARNAACTKSCKSKEKEFRDYCDTLQ